MDSGSGARRAAAWLVVLVVMGAALIGCAADGSNTGGAGNLDRGATGVAGQSAAGAGAPIGAAGAAGTGQLPPPLAGSGGVGAAGTGGMVTVPVAGTAALPMAGAGGAAGAAGAAPDAGAPDSGEPDAPAPVAGCEVGPVPEALRQERDLDPFYQKYADANGIPIFTSSEPDDRALTLACQLVIELVSDRDDVRQALIRNRVHFTVIGFDELTTDTPEYSDLPDYYNTRARGLGGQVASCAEESIFCDRARDRWYGESICVHEYAHTVSMYGLYSADTTFERRLTDAYNAARSAGLFQNTYFMENPQEYWAEGVQNWYETNLTSATPNGVHGPIDTRDELREYDPALYDLIDELLPDVVSWDDCYRH